MAQNKKAATNRGIRKNLKDMTQLDKVAQKMLSLTDPSYNEREILANKNEKFQSIVNRELELSKGVAGGSIVDFMLSLKDNDKKAKGIQSDNEIDLNSLFENNMGDIFAYFQDLYKNRYIEIRDLKFISKFIPALGEAVKTTLDGITTSDDLSDVITRNLVFGSGLDDGSKDKEKVISKIEGIEKELNLLKTLKNVVYKNSIVTGNFYVYAVSYKKLFSEYSKAKSEGKFDKNNVWLNEKNIITERREELVSNEGYTIPRLDSMACESCVTNDDFKSMVEEMFKEASQSDPKTEKKQFQTAMEEIMPEVYLYTGRCLTDSVVDFAAMEASKTYNAFFGDNSTDEKVSSRSSGDMYSEVSAPSDGKAEKFETVNGTYLKFIDYKNIIPVKVMNQTTGYYHVHAEKKKKDGSGSIVATTSMFNFQNMTEKKKEAAIQNISDIITQKVISKFSEKFVVNNSDFKKLVADCILEHGVANNQFHIQFIPASDIIEFPVNPDEEGNGISILADALFPAKLLLSLLVCKLLLYMNNSGSKSIAHIYKGPIDLQSSNQVQRVIRNLQESNITFVDLLSTNLTFNKFARDSRISMPTSKGGQHLVEFETMDGQTVDLHTDLEDKLEQMAIIGTGVPSVIMEYVNQADFAKSITSANIKFAGRIASLQSDLEDPTTKLYEILIRNSGLEEEVINTALADFHFKLPRPKALSSSNSNDFLSNLTQLTDQIVTVMIGESTAGEGDFPKIKDLLKKKIMKKYAPYIDWDDIEDMMKAAKIEIEKTPEADTDNGTGGGTDMGDENDEDTDEGSDGGSDLDTDF